MLSKIWSICSGDMSGETWTWILRLIAGSKAGRCPFARTPATCSSTLFSLTGVPALDSRRVRSGVASLGRARPWEASSGSVSALDETINKCEALGRCVAEAGVIPEPPLH